MALGSSQFTNIGSTVELYSSAIDAKAPVLALQVLSPEEFGQLVAAVAGVPGLDLDNISAAVLDLPEIGDLNAGFQAEVETPSGTFQGHMVNFSQGRIFGQLVLIGPVLELEDTLALARLMETRISENKP